MQKILVTSEEVRVLREFNAAIEALIELGNRNVRRGTSSDEVAAQLPLTENR